MSKVLIDRALLERVQERLDPHRDAVLWGAVCDTFHTAPSGTPAMPVKAYYHEWTDLEGVRTRSVGLEVRKEFTDAPLVLEADALARVACLECEIAKRDEELAACRVAVENCEVFRARIAELAARIVWLECEAQVNAAPVSEAKAQGVVMPERDSFMAGVKAASDKVKAIVEDYDQRHGSTDPDTGTREYPGNGEEWVCCMLELIEDFTGIVAPSSLAAAPAAPAADAGIVDMYRHLQKVTPYRFKKIQDASITDGGDVMYFHKDRFDAALLADMAAHCAAKGVV